MPLNQNKITSEGTALLSPDTILQSRYQIVRQLGRGGMGAVYEAIDLRLGHIVAIKQTLTEDVELWKQFEREARLMAQLNHPVLPRVSDYFTERNRAFFAMQFVEGLDLAEILAQQPGPFPRQAMVAWADQLLDALIYLHSHDSQIIHRDIKPHNLKVTSLGRIILLDFGLAKSQAAATEEDGLCQSIFGYTPRYAPLEQIQDLGTTPQSDIYALGATLYHLLTGVKPSDSLTRAAALISSRPNPLKPAHEINPSVGPDLSAILSRAMAQNPDQRYASALDFREALRRLGRSENNERIEFVAHPGTLAATVADLSDTTFVASMRVSSVPRMGEGHALAAVLILLAAFAVFCGYYPWKLPTTAKQESAVTRSALSLDQSDLSLIVQSRKDERLRARKGRISKTSFEMNQIR